MPASHAGLSLWALTAVMILADVACHQKKAPNLVQSPAVEWLPAEAAGAGSWSWVLQSGEQSRSVEVRTVTLLTGEALFLATADGEAKRGTALFPRGDGLIFGIAEIPDEGEARFNDAYFFKLPATAGETYDMNEYLRREGMTPLKVDGGTIVGLERYSPRRGGEVEVLTHELTIPPYRGAEVPYSAKWYWAKGAGLIRMENVDRFGSVAVTEGFERAGE